MPTQSLRQTAALLVLGAALLTPSLATAAGRSRAEPREQAAPRGVLALLWGALASVWGEAGCSIDPSGLTGACHQGLAAPTGQEGCSLDPSGAACSRATALTGLAGDNGCSIDPDGCSK